jgi:hypothetical protein
VGIWLYGDPVNNQPRLDQDHRVGSGEVNEIRGKLWLDVLALGSGKVDASKLAQIERAIEQVLNSQELELDPNTARQGVSSRFKAWGLSPGAVHSLDQAFMGLLRRAALSGLLPPPPEGPWNSQWQLLIDASPDGSKAVLKALAGWCFRRGVAASDVTNELLAEWQRERHMTASDVRSVADLIPQVVKKSHQMQASNPHLLTRLKARNRTGMTRTLSEQYGISRTPRRRSDAARNKFDGT